MEPYIHTRRSSIHVIDLRKTIRGIFRAQNFLYHTAGNGQQILWVGTKRQVKSVIRDAGDRTGQPVVTERWIGGTLTNFSVIRSRLRRLEELEAMEEDGSLAQYSKKMVASLRRDRRKIHRNLSGIRDMNGIPGAMVVVDPAREYNAVREARKMGVVVIGICDTDCDPTQCDIVIPGNDDALKSVRLMIEYLSSSVEEGASNHVESMASVGAAERASDDGVVGDEPRPTRSRKLPKLRSAAGDKDKQKTEAAATPNAAATPDAAEAMPEAKADDKPEAKAETGAPAAPDASATKSAADEAPTS